MKADRRFPGREMLLRLAAAGIALQGGAPDDDDSSGGEAGEADRAAAAEKRARAAEAEAKRLKTEAKKREDADRQRQLDLDLEDKDKAKNAAKAAEDRAKAAEAEAEALRAKLVAQTDAKIAKLPDDAKARIEKFRSKLDLADLDEMVDDELSRAKASGGDVSGDSSGTGQSGVNAPPPGVGAITRVTDSRGEGRKLQPRSSEILHEMGVDERPGRRLLDMVSDGKSSRFEIPARDLTDLMTRRAKLPAGLLSDEVFEKLITRKR